MKEEIVLNRSTLLFEATKECGTNTAVLFLPGISGKAFSDRFQPLVAVCLEAQLPIVRMHAWEDEADVQMKTLEYFHEAIGEVLELIKGKGFQSVVAIGKSFGGGLLLSYQDKSITKKILWAPAIGVGETDTFNALKNTELSGVTQLLDIQITKEFVHHDTAEIYIIHGTDDDVMPLSNSKTAVAAAREGEIHVIEDADHSFKTSEHEQALMEATKKALHA